MTLNIDRVLSRLTLEEKASLLSGQDFWNTQEISCDGEVVVPSIWVTDGPHGLRKQVTSADHLGVIQGLPATCFPTAVTLASTWDPGLVERVGRALGVETRASDVAVLLGPGVNIKRSPLCGRNFEYFSEDPFLTGELATALVRGVQAEGVGTSLKHFAANNQETDRMRVSSEVDERTLREIYLPAFEKVVKDAQPWTVMCSYNRINGVYASQNRWLLTEVLRDEWGFEGLVVSDWGAVVDRVAGVLAGLDLQMPADGGRLDATVVAAVRDGRLSEADIDACARRMLQLVSRALPAVRADGSYDADAHHTLAREAAAAGTVLLANDPIDGQPLLPLARGAKVAVIGELARTPRYQGAGSSQVTPTTLDNALDALRETLGEAVSFAAGYTLTEGSADAADLVAEAVAAATTADTVLLFLGLPPEYESEGYDRTHIDLPPEQVAVLQAIATANPRVVVVLANGSAVSVAPWRRLAPAIVEGWLGGQAGGSAIADVLTGAVNPAGRLAETIPVKLSDNPTVGNFPGEHGRVRYGEGLLVGYRWYDTRGMEVAFPFGHGLSYTTFEHGIPEVTVTGQGAEVTAHVRVPVTNTGTRAGAEVVQVYVRDVEASVFRPERELKGFAKVTLEPGETAVAQIDLPARAFSFWHPALRRWVVEGGEFEIAVGASSRDLRHTVAIDVVGEAITPPLHERSTLAEVRDHPTVGEQIRQRMAAIPLPDEVWPMLLGTPIISVVDFGALGMDRADLSTLLAQANG